ncbi:hypothetical protein [Psychroflexus sp. MBR-150]|jgi:glycosyltransferase involved in cell wall biosynthesis
MKNEQILYVPEIDISIDDGSGINERNFVRALLEKKINVLIPKPKNREVINNLFSYDSLKTTYHLNRRNPFDYLYFIFKKNYDIYKINKHKNIGVVSFRMGLIPLDIYLTKKILKRKVYLKHLTFMTSSQTNNIFLNIAGKIRLRFVNKNYIDGCDTPSYMTKQIIEKEYGVSNVFIARNGTSKVAFINKEVKREKDYIYIGRLSKGRNTDKLLEAFAKSNKNIDIYGFGEMESLVRGFSKKCSNINFYGKVPYTQLTKILYQYKYGIDLTYVDTEFGKASYSQKIAQYLSFGLNVLAIDCVDNEYIKENNCGVLYNVDSNSLIEIVNSYEYRKIDLLKIEDAIYSDKIVNQLIEFWKQK